MINLSASPFSLLTQKELPLSYHVHQMQVVGTGEATRFSYPELMHIMHMPSAV